jgi:hypothetical protein
VTAAVLVLAGCSLAAVTVHPPAPTGSVAEQCAHLGNALPQRIESLRPRVISPRSPLVHAWGNPAVVLTCGVVKPAGYSAATAQLADVNGVSWFEQQQGNQVVWTTLRPAESGPTVNVQLVVPTHYQAQGAFLVDFAQPLKTALP